MQVGVRFLCPPLHYIYGPMYGLSKGVFFGCGVLLGWYLLFVIVAQWFCIVVLGRRYGRFLVMGFMV